MERCFFIKGLLSILTINLVIGNMHAQSLDQAKKLYNEGKYAEAKPAFEKLVKQAPSNSSYNHWYGVCSYETGNMEEAEKHLLFSVKRKVQESYRYLSDLYFKTYRFDEAAEMMQKYIDILTKKKQDTEVYDQRSEFINNARRMVDKVENIQIIDSMVVNKDKLLSAYTLSEESGSLATYKDFFQTNEPVNSTVYMNQKGDKIFYAHPTDENQYCLFSQSKLLNKWGDEKQLPMNINSGQEDNYPFVMPDGVTIYYASKGNGSIGGYDLFVTRYNSGNDTYLAPEQLGMPFNSIANDYMIVFDENKKLGWFVSDRFQPEGKACVYLFIPNSDHSRIESDDANLKRSRAAVFSIQESWLPNTNYTGLIELAHKAIPYGVKKVEKDFDFIVNDKVTYFKLNEIKSPEAKNYYEKYLSITKQIKDLNKRIDGMRKDYTAGNAARKKQLKPSILAAEEEIYNLLPQPEEWEKKARNAEIQYLKAKR